jgi:hypothetical protein
MQLGDGMAIGIFDDLGIRFEYPPTWEIDVSEDSPRTSVTVQSSAGPAFAMVTVDETRPAPEELADEALAALREEYPTLDAAPASETIDGHNAIGHDVEFLSLDMTNSCVIRCFRTPRRTVFVLTHWSDLEEDEPEHALAAVRRSLEETDS